MTLRNIYVIATVTACLSLVGCAGNQLAPTHLPEFETGIDQPVGIEGFEGSVDVGVNGPSLWACAFKANLRNDSDYPVRIILAESSVQIGDEVWPLSISSNEDIVIHPKEEITRWFNSSKPVGSTHTRFASLCGDPKMSASERGRSVGFRSILRLTFTQMDRRALGVWHTQIQGWRPNPLCKKESQLCENKELAY